MTKIEEIKTFLESHGYLRIVSSIVIVLIALIVYKAFAFIISRCDGKDKLHLFTSKKSKTYLRLIKNVMRYVIFILTILILLQLNGVDVSSLLAGLGIISVIVGLALQDWLKDIIRGTSILSDNYFSVGDIVKYKGIEAKVLMIGLKTTKLQDIYTNNVISIANRNIEEIEVVSELVYVRIPLPHDLNIKNAERLISDVIFNIKSNNNVTDCIYKGTTELETSYINYLIEVHCSPQYKLQVKRDALRSMLIVMEEYDVHVPYNQIEIHNNRD